MTDNTFYVYLHRRKSDNKPFYVGKGSGNRCRSVQGRNQRWKNTFNKHGMSIEILYDNLTEDEAFALEKDAILEMRYHYENYLCNLTDGGEGVSGYKWSEANPNVPHYLKGKKISDQHRENISIACKGKSQSSECFQRFKQWRQEKAISQKVFTFMVKQLRNRSPIPLLLLSKVSGVDKKALTRKPKEPPVISRAAIEKSAENRRGRPAWNKGLKSPNTSLERNPCADLNIYQFQHINGTIFTGTRYELCAAHTEVSVDAISKLFCKKPYKRVKGWHLVKESND